jgi:hypothetical protein
MKANLFWHFAKHGVKIPGKTTIKLYSQLIFLLTEFDNSSVNCQTEQLIRLTIEIKELINQLMRLATES